jgi:hypothetical protein
MVGYEHNWYPEKGATMSRELKAGRTKEEVAEHVHEVNRAYCRAIEGNVPVSWAEASPEHRASLVNAVEITMANPEMTPADRHANWMRVKRAAGWEYGPEKDVEAKLHPCMVPFDELPRAQKAKDSICHAVVLGHLA